MVGNFDWHAQWILLDRLRTHENGSLHLGHQCDFVRRGDVVACAEKEIWVSAICWFRVSSGLKWFSCTEKCVGLALEYAFEN